VEQQMVDGGHIWQMASELEYRMVDQFFSLNHPSFSPVYLSRHRLYFFESLLCEQHSHCSLLEFD
jgi:hypothetical protein